MLDQLPDELDDDGGSLTGGDGDSGPAGDDDVGDAPGDGLGGDGDGPPPGDVDPVTVQELLLTDNCSAFAGMVFRNSIATVFNPNGVMSVVDGNTERCDHALDGSLLGLLIEPEAVNFIPRSAALGATAAAPPDGWVLTNQNASSQLDFTSDPQFPPVQKLIIRGAGTADGNGVSTVRFSEPVATNPGEVWTISAWHRLAGGAPTGTTCGGIGIDRLAADNTTVEGSAESTPAPTSAWQRMTATLIVPAGATGSVRARYRVGCLDPAESFVVEVAAPQLERGSIATSYIPTSTMSLTRNGELLKIQMTGGVVQGASFGAHANVIIDTTGTGFWFGAGVLPPTDANFVGAQINAAMPAVALRSPQNGGNTSVNYTGITRVGSMRIGFSTTPTGANMAVNNSFSGQSAQITQDVSQLLMYGDGIGSSSTPRIRAHVRRVWFVDRTLSDEDLEAQVQSP